MFVRTQDRSRIINMDCVYEIKSREIDVLLNKYNFKAHFAAGIQTICLISLHSETNDNSIRAACYIDRQSAEDTLEALCNALRDGRGYFEFPADYKFMEVQNEGS